MKGKNILSVEPDILPSFNRVLRGEANDVFISDITEISEYELNPGLPLDIELLSQVATDGIQHGVVIGVININ